ncbi:MAG: hypothetical protein QGF00_13975, partial [Planctomycetota bacterium]|nr:hypothetical protein [Planctomycetota bacterium]
MSTESNLLFGVMAVQNGFINPQQLADAAALWANDKEREIGEILVEQDWISDEIRQVLKTIVEKSVEAHGGDAAKSLDSFSGAGEVLRSLGGLDDGEIQESLLSLGSIQSGDPAAAGAGTTTKDTDTGLYPAAPGRYEIKEIIGEGGLGRVYLAIDSEMQRDVALKELLPEKTTAIGTPVRQSGQRVARFLAEARVTGHLEHPSIIPVYEVGQREDG